MELELLQILFALYLLVGLCFSGLYLMAHACGSLRINRPIWCVVLIAMVIAIIWPRYARR